MISFSGSYVLILRTRPFVLPYFAHEIPFFLYVTIHFLVLGGRTSSQVDGLFNIRHLTLNHFLGS